METQLRTPGILAGELNEPLHHVLYVLRTRRHIKPAARAGMLRLYDNEATAMVRYELNLIAARRASKAVPA